MPTGRMTWPPLAEKLLFAAQDVTANGQWTQYPHGASYYAVDVESFEALRQAIKEVSDEVVGMLNELGDEKGKEGEQHVEEPSRGQRGQREQSGQRACEPKRTVISDTDDSDDNPNSGC